MGDGVKTDGTGEGLGLDHEVTVTKKDGTGITVEKFAPEGEGNKKMEETERLAAYASAFKRQEYVNKYNSITYDCVSLRIRHDGDGEGIMKGLTREKIKTAAVAAGMSMSEFILQRACESMSRRGEVFPAAVDGGKASKNRELIVRGDAAGYLIDTAKELGMEPRELVLAAVSRYAEEARAGKKKP